MNMRRTRDDWLDLVTRQAGSGLSVAEFCRRHELLQNSFYRWRRVLADEVESSFVPLAITDSRSIEIELPCGAILKVSANRGTLGEVFAALLSIEAADD
jgi:transposase-like protein